MADQPVAYLLVERGDPYPPGELLPLPAGRAVLGRAWRDQRPDIPFANPYVSRRHARIDSGSHTLGFQITDLPESRHGTKVNGETLAKGVPRVLEDGDRIELAKAEVVLVFRLEPAPGETLDYSRSGLGVSPGPRASPALDLDEGRREALVDGRAITLTGKIHELFRVLWRNRGRVVDDETIKREVWPERARDARDVPLVDNEEIVTLVHRLRGQLGERGQLVRTVRGYGYLLEYER